MSYSFINDISFQILVFDSKVYSSIHTLFFENLLFHKTIQTFVDKFANLRSLNLFNCLIDISILKLIIKDNKIKVFMDEKCHIRSANIINGDFSSLLDCKINVLNIDAGKTPSDDLSLLLTNKAITENVRYLKIMNLHIFERFLDFCLRLLLLEELDLALLDGSSKTCKIPPAELMTKKLKTLTIKFIT